MKHSLPFDTEHLDARQIEEHIERLSVILDRYVLSRIEYEIDDTRFVVEKSGMLQVGSTQGLPAVQPPHPGADATANQSSGTTKPGMGHNTATTQQEQSHEQGDLSHIGDPESAFAKVIRAPLVGIAYRSKEPGSPPFVEVGDTVEVGTTLCLVEAMKMFNEVQASFSGTITKIHFEDSKLVEHGAPLFTLK